MTLDPLAAKAPKVYRRAFIFPRGLFMRHVIALVGLFGLGLVAVGCSASSDDSVATVDEGLAGGCKMVCPKCPPNKICPMIACYQECNGKPKTCVQTALCIQGYTWDSKACQCVPSSPQGSSCTTDSDCRVFSDYCTGCDCRALSTSEADPTCSGPGVRCFADPCMNHTAVCIGGTCSLQ